MNTYILIKISDMTIKQQEQLISDTKRKEQFKIVKKINKFQKEVHNGKIDIEEFYHKVAMLKNDIENGII